LAAGVVAGLAADVPLHPLDTIKTRLQSQSGFKASGGLSGLWSGLTPVLIRGAPCSAMFFMTYEKLKRELPTHRFPMLADAAAGAGANIVSCSVRVPAEVLKQRMQADGVGLKNAVRDILRTTGPRGFYAGSSVSVLRELAFAAIQMPLYEELMRCNAGRLDAESRSRRGMIGAAFGGIAGATAGALTTPLDVIKTRSMLAQSNPNRLGFATGPEQHIAARIPSLGMSSAFKTVYAEGGLKRLFAGVVPRTAYVCFSSALWLGAFESCRSWLM